MNDAEVAKEAYHLLVEFAGRLDARLITRGPPDAEEPYLWRGYLMGDDSDDKYNAFLHKFVASDAPGELHCHPWSTSISFILLGSYKETMCFGSDAPGLPTLNVQGEGTWKQKILTGPRQRVFSPGICNVIKANTFHRVELLTPEVWTLFIHGPRVQQWGFVEEGKYGVPVPMKVVKGKTSAVRPAGNMAKGIVGS